MVYFFLKIGWVNGMIWCVVVKVSCYFVLLSMDKSVLLRQERVNEKFACRNLLRQELRNRAHANFSIHKMKFDLVLCPMVERCAVSHLLVYALTYKYKTRLQALYMKDICT